MARLQRVYIDTSELFPFTIMDVLLTLCEDFHFTWLWTDEILDEWAEVIVREDRRTPASAASVVEAVRSHFGRSRTAPELYRNKVTNDLSPDPDDRVHAAAAMYGGVDVLLTRNLKHLRTPPVLAAGVTVMNSDEFLCALLERRRAGVVESFTRAAGNRTDPHVLPDELATKIARAGAPGFAEQIRRYLPR